MDEDVATLEEGTSRERRAELASEVIGADRAARLVNRTNIETTGEFFFLTMGQIDSLFESTSMEKTASRVLVLDRFAFGASSFAQSHFPAWAKVVMRWAASTGSDELMRSIEELLTTAIDEGKEEGLAARGDDN